MDLKKFSDDLDVVYSRLKENLNTVSRDYDWRIDQLKALKKLLVDNDEALCDAMWKDLRKSKFECVVSEQGVVLSEIEFTLKHLSQWMKPERVSTPLFTQPGHCDIYHDPLGLALIIGAWNYPINLLLAPLVGAIAGGNGAILKPSEMTVNTAALLAQIIPSYLDMRLFSVITGGADETEILLDKKFDTIFFTGSGKVGRLVMAKAAKNLTPVTLELGGKSPAMILPDAQLDVAARRIAWGKFMNAGQTCVAPDYILIHPSVKVKFIDALMKEIRTFYGENIRQSPDYCRIVNDRNFDRLVGLAKNEKILFGGESVRDELYIEPTVLETTVESLVMQEEIFGPILPIVEMPDIDKMIEFVNSRDKPLSLYLFCEEDAVQEKVIAKTSAGGMAVNDVVIHMPIPDFPFGGVGPSGMGRYHGKYSFETFTHAKGVLRKATWIDVPVRYAPYTLRNLKILRWLF